jgi:hypothetical protein
MAICSSQASIDVLSKVARELGWKPITELICEIHEGDESLRRTWPLNYSLWNHSTETGR